MPGILPVPERTPGAATPRWLSPTECARPKGVPEGCSGTVAVRQLRSAREVTWKRSGVPVAAAAWCSRRSASLGSTGG